MPMQGSLSIEQMCRLSSVSRAGFYRSLQERMPVEEDMELRSAIQQIAVEHRRRCGYPDALPFSEPPQRVGLGWAGWSSKAEQFSQDLLSSQVCHGIA